MGYAYKQNIKYTWSNLADFNTKLFLEQTEAFLTSLRETASANTYTPLSGPLHSVEKDTGIFRPRQHQRIFGQLSALSVRVLETVQSLTENANNQELSVSALYIMVGSSA